MARKPLSEEQIAQMRKSFCDTAYQLYQKEDYHAVSMRGIAKAMGHSPMMAYRYFENKEEVFAELRANLFNQLAEYLEQVSTSLSPTSYLNALSYAYVQFAREHPHAYRLLYVIHLHQAGQYASTNTAQKRTRKILLNATQRAIDAKVIQGDAKLIAHILWASIHGLISLDLANQLTQGVSFDELMPAMVDCLFKNYK